MGINLNRLALQIAMQETGKREVSIAQIKEILKITLQQLAIEEPDEVLRIIKRYR